MSNTYLRDMKDVLGSFILFNRDYHPTMPIVVSNGAVKAVASKKAKKVVSSACSFEAMCIRKHGRRVTHNICGIDGERSRIDPQ